MWLQVTVFDSAVLIHTQSKSQQINFSHGSICLTQLPNFDRTIYHMTYISTKYFHLDKSLIYSIPENFSNYRLSILLASEFCGLLLSMVFDVLRFLSSFIPESSLLFSKTINHSYSSLSSQPTCHFQRGTFSLVSCFFDLAVDTWRV